MNDWYNHELYNCKNVLFIRGISIYNPKPTDNNLLLFISHPESYSREEFSQYRKIISCSKLFYERIKSDLDSDIIFTLQPIDIPFRIKRQKLIYDGVFIGNKIRTHKSVSWLTRQNLKGVKIFGEYWSDEKIKPVINNVESLSNTKVFDYYATSKIILMTWDHMRQNGFITGLEAA